MSVLCALTDEIDTPRCYTQRVSGRMEGGNRNVARGTTRDVENPKVPPRSRISERSERLESA